MLTPISACKSGLDCAKLNWPFSPFFPFYFSDNFLEIFLETFVVDFLSISYWKFCERIQKLLLSSIIDFLLFIFFDIILVIVLKTNFKKLKPLSSRFPPLQRTKREKRTQQRKRTSGHERNDNPKQGKEVTYHPR